MLNEHCGTYVSLLNMPSTGSKYAKAIKKLLVSSDRDHVIYQVDFSA